MTIILLNKIRCGKRDANTWIVREIFWVGTVVILGSLCLTDRTAKVFHISRPSTVQSLLLLGYREFGIGSMEQGWIFIGKLDNPVKCHSPVLMWRIGAAIRMVGINFPLLSTHNFEFLTSIVRPLIWV
jgi:hypothetical protein